MKVKNATSTTREKNVARQVSHMKLMTVVTTFGLLLSQSVYAADEASSVGIPGWVWGLLVVAILVGITLLPKKWIEPNQAKPLEKKTPAPTPTAKAVEPSIPTTAEIPKVTPQPVVETPIVTPVAIQPPQAIVEAVPQPEKPVEVDALDEAKQLLAQQRFPQAVGVLNKGLQKNPERSDLMLELLAIYLKQNDHEAFDAQFEQLKQLDDPLALIQGEELHELLERPIVVEHTDLIEFDTKKAVAPIPEPESIPETEAPDYSADSLVFTSEKPVVTEPEPIKPQEHDAESASFGKTVEVTPIETEFSLDDLDFEPSTVAAKESVVDTSAKKPTDDFDFSDFDDFVINAPTETTPSEPVVKSTEPADLAAPEVDVQTSFAELTELKAPAPAVSPADDLIDLEFDLDDNFAIDEDKVETTAKKSEWATDLADENFAAPTQPAPVVTPTVGELISGDALSSLEEEFPFLQTADTFQTRLDLARNYIVLGEISSAKELLNEVVAHGTGTQQTEAQELIAKLA